MKMWTQSWVWMEWAGTVRSCGRVMNMTQDQSELCDVLGELTKI